MLQFPEYMRRQRRWMATRGGKLPVSIHQPPSGAVDNWAVKWNNPDTWATYDEAAAFTQELCFVMHGDWEADRVICLDFDGCYVNGVLTVAVQAFLEKYPTFVEKSSSGTGLHAFYLYNGPKFKSRTRFQFPGCKLDILFNAQIRVTGVPAEMSRTLQRLDYQHISSWVKIDDGLDIDDTGIWEQPAQDLDPYLVDLMETQYLSIEGQGGDNELFRAACELARYGVTGHTAVEYLKHVPADPEWPEDKIQLKVRDAYTSVGEVDEWQTYDVPQASAFDDYMAASQDAQGDEYKTVGLNSISWGQIRNFPTRPYLVDELFIDKATLFIGGREKCFKTTIAADLALSLATASPFLGKFDVAERRKVLFISAENEIDDHKDILERVARNKQLDLSVTEDWFRLTTQIPEISLNRRNEVVGGCLDALNEELAHYKHQVAVFDPLYFMVSNVPLVDMLGVRVVLKAVRDLCKLHNVWPIFCHHANSRKAREEFAPMELGDFYGSGVQQFARQWLLLSHAEEMVKGKAVLHVNVGGSKGKKPLYRLEINEGTETEMTRREWDVAIDAEDQNTRFQRGYEEAIEFISTNDLAVTMTDVRQHIGLGKRETEDVLGLLLREEKIDMQGNRYFLKDRLPDQPAY